MMPELYKGKIPIIRRSLNEGFIRGTPDVEPSFGCVPRDYSIDPVRMADSPAEMELVNPSDLDAIYDMEEEAESSLEHIYLRGDKPAFEFLDQNGFPDCWSHSTGHAIMLARARQNLPPIRLNAVAVATLIGQLNGGWSGLSMRFARDHGFPVIGDGPGEWPYQSRRGRDTAELRAAMALHKSVEDWYDFGRKEWDQQLSIRQLDTSSANNWPVPVDFNEYGHAMCMVRRVRIERGARGSLILNSWQGFGYHGLCVIPDSTASADGACALRVTTNSVK